MGFELLFYFTLFEDNNNGLPKLSLKDRRRRDRRTPRIAILHYNKSSFHYLFQSGDDQALLNCCGVDHKVFRSLLAIFEPSFHYYMVDEETGRIRKRTFTRHGLPKGRTRHVTPTCCLGLVLFWYRTRGSVARATAMAFGLTSTPLYKWLKFGRRILLGMLHKHPLAKVSLPSPEELQSYIVAIGNKYQVLQRERVWGAADGLKLRLQQSTDWAIQNKYYNGWTGGTYVNSVFVFAPDGRIQIATINAPGTFHDSTMADYGIYEKMGRLFKDFKVKVVVDSAFNLKDVNCLIKSSQKDPMDKGAHGVRLNRAATSVRQLSEHGMRMIQGQFPRLKDPLTYEEFGERKVILNLMVVLYNFQTSTVGINHILNSFMSNTKGFKSYDAAKEFRGRTTPFHSYPQRIDANANDVFI